MSNLMNLKTEIHIWRNEEYRYLNPIDIKKLPITEENKSNLIVSLKTLPADLNTINGIGEVIKQLKINKKKYPKNKQEIEDYFGTILKNFFEFNIGHHELIEKSKQFSIEKNKINDYKNEHCM